MVELPKSSHFEWAKNWKQVRSLSGLDQAMSQENLLPLND
jgi:hypothetical protein